MGNLFSNSPGFHWEYTETPHANRRIEMLKKYPELKQLMKSDGDRLTVIIGFIFVLMQFGLAYMCSQLPYTPISIFLSVTMGSWLATGIFLQIHECGHGLTFGPNSVWKNRLYGLFLNLPLIFPVFAFFKKHHKIHHKYQGESELDVEYATEPELAVFKGSLGKYVWILLNPFLQIWRALRSKHPEKLAGLSMEETMNLILVNVFNAFLIMTGHSYMMFLLFLSNIAALSTTFIGFWGISLHTEFFNMEETRNFHGWINLLFMNFGYHVEHHDFPNIPGRLLPKVRQVAPEFYTDYYIMDSLYVPIVKFVYDPKYGVFSRLKHKTR